ncbi:dnaJ homolog subfamily C member 3-like [Diadema antillarum]|uniref:dnaJ homolog subfamily C member 3-like n=1 Tax=Diadema antillarum TaxID=105358 RepID=UPI003A870B12
MQSTSTGKSAPRAFLSLGLLYGQDHTCSNFIRGLRMINLHSFFSSLPVLLVTLSLHYDDGEAKSEAEARRYMENGNTLLAAGQLADALAQYNAAIDNDPDNYMVYYKRAAVYLAQGKSKLALPDLKKSMDLKADFTPAIINHGNILFKQGHIHKAREDYESVLKYDRLNKEADKQLGLTHTVEERIKIGDQMFAANNMVDALDAYSRVILYLPWNAEMHRKRAKVYHEMGELYKMIDDLKAVTKLVPDSTEVYLEMSRLHDSLGDLDFALEDIRECLKLDPDHKECFALYKLLKKIKRFLDASENFIRDGRYDDAISKLESAIETAGSGGIYEIRANARICHAHRMAQHTSEALKICGLVLKQDPENVDVLIDRAEACIQNEMYDEAVSSYQKADEIEDSQRTQEGLDRSQKLLKQSKKRDYYKILGVKRNAVKKDILKAYRQLAMQWHPDKHEGDDKAKAEKMFMDIADAKEVLTDPEMRQKFDAGEDPLDPEQQQQHHHHHNPFGFNPFGGGGFQFKFHFN